MRLKTSGGRTDESRGLHSCLYTIPNFQQPPRKIKKTKTTRKTKRNKTRSDKLDGLPPHSYSFFFFSTSIISTSVCSSLLDTTRCCFTSRLTPVTNSSQFDSFVSSPSTRFDNIRVHHKSQKEIAAHFVADNRSGGRESKSVKKHNGKKLRKIRFWV